MFSKTRGYGTKTWKELKKIEQYQVLKQRFLLAAAFVGLLGYILYSPASFMAA